MSTTIIFSNMGDVDTEVLRNLWNGIADAKVVEITKFTRNAEDLVNDAIAEETDTLIMCGHGTPDGLINPNFTDRRRYLIGGHNIHFINAQRIIGIWCHAKQFAEQFGVRGFWSSMFISNIMEARLNGIFSTTAKKITANEIKFCKTVNVLLKTKVLCENWLKFLFATADFNDPVIRFNYNGLAYFAEAPAPKRHLFNFGDYDSIMSFEHKRWGWNF